MASSNSAPVGLNPAVAYGERNQLAFTIAQALNRLQTSTLVEVVAVTNSGGVSPVGFVDVRPMIAQVDAHGKGMEHATIYGVPYFRLQGGANAIILDPQVGDIGLACFASRDISSVKKTKKRGNPATLRKYDYSDALYVGGMLNGTPSQYVQFSASGITIHSPNAVTLDAPNVSINAATIGLNASASLALNSPAITVNAIDLLLYLTTHNHSGVTTGTGNSGDPIWQ